MPARQAYPNPENATLEEIKIATEGRPNKRSYVRLNAIRSILKGIDRNTVCQPFYRTACMEHLWRECFGRAGIDGLTTKSNPCRRRNVKLECV